MEDNFTNMTQEEQKKADLLISAIRRAVLISSEGQKLRSSILKQQQMAEQFNAGMREIYKSTPDVLAQVLRPIPEIPEVLDAPGLTELVESLIVNGIDATLGVEKEWQVVDAEVALKKAEATKEEALALIEKYSAEKAEKLEELESAVVEEEKAVKEG